MKFNINEVEIKDLSGTVLKVEGLGKSLGNHIYRTTSTLDWVAIATAIHAGEEVELSEQEADGIIAILKSPNCDFVNAVKVAIINHITNLK